jgi:hypothetical protein
VPRFSGVSSSTSEKCRHQVLTMLILILPTFFGLLKRGSASGAFKMSRHAEQREEQRKCKVSPASERQICRDQSSFSDLARTRNKLSVFFDLISHNYVINLIYMRGAEIEKS